MDCHCNLKRSILNIWLLLIVLLLPAPAPAVTTIDLVPSQGRLPLGNYLEFLEDPFCRLTIEQLSQAEFAPGFIPSTEETQNAGFTKSAFWARIRFNNSGRESARRLLEIRFPRIDSVDLFLPGGDGTYRMKQAGELIPLARREIQHRNPVFIIDFPPMTTWTVYLRYQDRSSVPFSPILWQPEEFLSSVKYGQFSLGLYYGGMLLLLIYNIILFLMLRSRSYFFYIIYVASYLCWQFIYNGLGNEYLWPASPWLTNYLITPAICLTSISALQFTKTFLQTGKHTPRVDAAFTLLMVLFGGLAPLSIIPALEVSLRISVLLAICFSPMILLAAGLSWRQGYRPARYFTIAWFFLLCGTMLLGLKSFGLLPSVFITEYGQQLGSAMEITLLSLALADQVNTLKQAKENAQATALQFQEQAREDLEMQVAERTRELSESQKKMEILSVKLGKYLPPQLYESIFTGKTEVKRQSRRKWLTVFFSDIKGFTVLTDGMEPEALTEVLNDYLNEMAKIALQYGGTIDKFIGDAVMVFFGDPESRGQREDALACVRMAVAMREKITELRRNWENCSTRNNSFHVRMGINSGYCTVGNFGADDRLDYTIMGSEVIVANRLETIAEADQILISQTTYTLVREHFHCQMRGTLPMKGFPEPVKTYQVLGLSRDDRQRFAATGTGYSISLDLAALTVEARQGVRSSLRLALDGLAEPSPEDLDKREPS